MEILTYRKEQYEEDLFIVHSKTSNFKMAVPHFHDGYELHFTLTDNTVYQIGDSTYQAKSGSIAVINQDEIHRAIVPQNCIYERIILSFKPSFVHDISNEYPELTMPFTKRYPDFNHCIWLPDKQERTLFDLFMEMKTLYTQQEPYAIMLKKKVILLRILLYVSELYATSDSQMSVKSKTMSKQIVEIIQYINNNLAEDLSLDTLSAMFFISKSNLMRMFKSEMSMTPNRYIVFCRIMKSREYLRQGMPVYMVCSMVGYQDESSFIRVFKKIMNCTPKKYAEQENDAGDKIIRKEP